jgi:hypothetical protein
VSRSLLRATRAAVFAFSGFATSCDVLANAIESESVAGDSRDLRSIRCDQGRIFAPVQKKISRRISTLAAPLVPVHAREILRRRSLRKSCDKIVTSKKPLCDAGFCNTLFVGP